MGKIARALLTGLAAVLYAVGYASRKVRNAPAWIAAAFRLGWEDAA
ncbi:hypothetical protein [Streptomyces sp. CC53]|nr:hypothetical protein [Streptomyces sp. CC53]